MQKYGAGFGSCAAAVGLAQGGSASRSEGKHLGSLVKVMCCS